MTASPPRPLVAIVDDDEPFRRSMERLVRAAGYRVAAYESGEDFLAHADPNGTACVILDMKLPGMSGFDLQRRLIARERRIPIIFVSAHDDGVMRTNAIRAGALAFLSKPFATRELLQAIQHAVDVTP